MPIFTTTDRSGRRGRRRRRRAAGFTGEGSRPESWRAYFLLQTSGASYAFETDVIRSSRMSSRMRSQFAPGSALP